MNYWRLSGIVLTAILVIQLSGGHTPALQALAQSNRSGQTTTATAERPTVGRSVVPQFPAIFSPGR
jgi:hypothetical protein